MPDAALLTLFGTIAGGVIGIAGKSLSDWLSVKKEREARRDQFRAEAEKWQRDRIASSLTQSVKLLNIYITLSIGKRLEDVQADSACRESSAEAQRALVEVIMVYPNKSAGEYSELVNSVDKAMWKAVPDVDTAWNIRQLIVRLAARIGVDERAADTSAVQTAPLTKGSPNNGGLSAR